VREDIGEVRPRVSGNHVHVHHARLHDSHVHVHHGNHSVVPKVIRSHHLNGMCERITFGTTIFNVISIQNA